MAVEAASLQASGNPRGTSIFQLNTTSVTAAVEAMMRASPDDICQFQEIKKDRADATALLKRLRYQGSQVSATPSAL